MYRAYTHHYPKEEVRNQSVQQHDQQQYPAVFCKAIEVQKPSGTSF